MAAVAVYELEPSARPRPELTPLELASGMVLGAIDGPTAGIYGSLVLSPPRSALAESLVPALARPPCFVAFSGGRDSSAMLAMATVTARERGLPDPVPLTLRFEAHPRTHEVEWQEIVVRHLGLREWVVRRLAYELDVVGPFAAGLLRRHGQYWPANAHTLALLLAEASGGALVTGNGGDEMCSPWTGRWVMEIGAGRRRLRRGEFTGLALWMAPAWLRRLTWRVRRPVRLPWLTAEGDRQLAWAVAGRWAEQAASWREQLERLLRARYLYLATEIFHTFARDADALLVEPFLDPHVVLSVAAALPAGGPSSRAAALEAVFGDLLPRATTRRSTKAIFNDVLWGPASRSFAATWDGSGIDTELVDPVGLRAAWAMDPPDLRSLTVLQAAWLAQSGAASEGRRDPREPRHRRHW